jgi:predicted transcriptional regulator
MANRVKVKIRADGVEGFFSRARTEAKKLDRGHAIEAGIIVNFAKAEDMAQCLSAERLRLLREVKSRKSTTVSDLAARLQRNRRAVDRDLGLLEGAGLLKVSYQSNPGHGRLKLVSPVARQYTLTATV